MTKDEWYRQLFERLDVSYVTDLMELECGQKLVRFYAPSGNLIEVRTPVSYN